MDKREIFDKIVELDPASSGSKYSMDDVSAALLFDDIFGDVFRFNGTTATWWRYDGERGIWAEDKIQRAEAAAEDFSKALTYYAESQGDRSFQRWAEGLQRHNARRHLLLDAAPLHAFVSDDLDTDLDLLNTADVVLNLEDFSTRPHDPNLMCSLVTNANMHGDPDKTAEGRAFFEKFLGEVLVDEHGDPDPDLTEYVQKIAGYSLTGRNRYEKFFICYGPDQRNGKSSFLETLAEAYGSYAKCTSAETIGKVKKGGPSWDLARLQGCRLLRVNEPNNAMTLDTALIKTLCGNDTVLARALYQSGVEFKPGFVAALNTNFEPSLTDSTLFTSRRCQVVPFFKHFSEATEDVYLKDKLKQPEVLDGVLQWALDGLRAIREDGFTAPPLVKKATRRYQVEGDRVSAYISERLRKADVSTKVDEIFTDYCAWAVNNNYVPMGKHSFVNDLRSKGMITRDRTAGNVVRGFVIKHDEMFIDNGGAHLEVSGQ